VGRSGKVKILTMLQVGLQQILLNSQISIPGPKNLLYGSKSKSSDPYLDPTDPVQDPANFSAIFNKHNIFLHHITAEKSSSSQTY
jgi:hypothetical protein